MIKSNNMTELAKTMIDDGQPTRAVWNYLTETSNNIKGHTFSFDGKTFENDIEFLEFVSHTCKWAIKAIKADNQALEEVFF